MSQLAYEHRNGVASFTFNNPPQNRLSTELKDGFMAVILDAKGRSDTRAVLLRSEGPNFSFGGDIRTWPDHTPESARAMIEDSLRLANAFEDFSVPVVVAVQGQCSGGGFEFALRGDIIIAADNARFGQTESTIGLFTLLGGVQRVAERVGRTRAAQWALMAELVPAAKALEYGLINDVVPLEDLDKAAADWAARLASGPSLAHADHKRLLRAWSDGGVRGADALIPEMIGATMTSNDAKGSMTAAVDALRTGAPRPSYSFKGD